MIWNKKNPLACKSWVKIPINSDAKPDDDVKIKDFPEMQVSTLKFKDHTNKKYIW